MIYRNKELMLRPFTKADMGPHYVKWLHDSEVTRHNSHGLFPYTTKQQEAYWNGIEAGERIVWAILSLYDGYHMVTDNHIGNASLQSISWVNRSAEFAIVIGNVKHHSKGVGTQVLKWAMEHAFVKMGLNRVWTGTSELNAGMRVVACRAGMEPEGIFKDGMWSNGRFVDAIAFGITRKMWLDLQKGAT